MTAIRKNNVRITGSGDRPLLFSHGFGCGNQVWDAVLPAFEREFRVITFDPMGTGGSDISQYDAHKYAFLDGHVRDLLAVCKELGLRDIAYVGHSVSGMIGILSAIEAPDLFNHLVLIGASPCHFNDGSYVGGFRRHDIEDFLAVMDGDFKGWCGEMASILMGNPERPELAAELGKSFRRMRPDIAKQFARAIFYSDYRDRLAELRVDSLILQCALDAISPPTVGEFLHRRIAGSRLEPLQATGHYPQLSAPQEIVQHIRSFLALDPDKPV